MKDELIKILKQIKKNRLYIFPLGKNGEQVLYILREILGCKNVRAVDNVVCKYNSQVLSLDEAAKEFKKGDKLLLTSCKPEIISCMRRRNVRDTITEQDIIELYKRWELIRDYWYDMRLVQLIDVSEEIYRKGVKGCVAEAGVYRGEFAQYINMFFPDRDLYLFDSFEGFNMNDPVEGKDSISEYDEWIEELKDTSVEIVMNKMRYKDRVIIRKGFVPNTFDGIEEKFAFVNLDMDLYKPIFDSLEWFFPRMSKGGYIFIHDFGLWAGAQKAVEDFCKKEKVGYFPIGDKCTVAIAVF